MLDLNLGTVVDPELVYVLDFEIFTTILRQVLF
jgi:hypothetical protein